MTTHIKCENLDRIAASRFIDVRGVRLHHLDHGGEAPPIVLVHGVAGSAWMWHAVAPALRTCGHVLALDLRGYGDSQWDADGEYTTETHAADVAALLDRLGLLAARFVGFSWGGLIGLHLACTRPELVERLAMIDIAPSFDASDREIPHLPLSFASHAEAVAAEKQQARFADPKLLQTLAGFATRPGAAGRLYKKYDSVFGERWPFRRDDRWDELAALTRRLLIVRPRDSQHVSREQAARMLAVARHAGLVEIDRTGHLVPIDNPAALGRALVEFFASEEGP